MAVSAHAADRYYASSLNSATQLVLIGTADSTSVEVRDLVSGYSSETAVNRGQSWFLSPPSGRFVLTATKPIVGLLGTSTLGSTFLPTSDGRRFYGTEFFVLSPPVGSLATLTVLAAEAATVSFIPVGAGSTVTTTLAANKAATPTLLPNTVYHVTATAKVALAINAPNGFTSVPPAPAGAIGTDCQNDLGTDFLLLTNGSGNGTFSVFNPQSSATTYSLTRLSDGATVLSNVSAGSGAISTQNGLGTNAYRLRSSAGVRVWSGDTTGGTGVAALGDDSTILLSAGGVTPVILHSQLGGAWIVASDDDVHVTINNIAQQVLNRDQAIFAPAQQQLRVVSDKPLTIQTAGGGAVPLSSWTVALRPAPSYDWDRDGVPDSVEGSGQCSAVDVDSDGDGRPDYQDSDDDDDGVSTLIDNCRVVANVSQVDLDEDGVGDLCDLDQDGDGVVNASDNCPLIANASQTNSDSDGLGDACDADDDNDSVADDVDNCPLNANSNQANHDGDLFGDVCDPDDDNDGVPDGSDNCPLLSNVDQANSDADGNGDLCDTDDDNDGVADSLDNCVFVANADQANADGDTLGDLCDPDDDNDLVPDGADNCPLVPNPGQSNIDSDSQGDACDNDADGDTIADAVDNCPVIANVDQANLDGDALGDACDFDDDGDNVPDVLDNCPAVPNPDQADADGDSLGDRCDDTPLPPDLASAADLVTVPPDEDLLVFEDLAGSGDLLSIAPDLASPDLAPGVDASPTVDSASADLTTPISERASGCSMTHGDPSGSTALLLFLAAWVVRRRAA